MSCMVIWIGRVILGPIIIKRRRSWRRRRRGANRVCCQVWSGVILGLIIFRRRRRQRRRRRRRGPTGMCCLVWPGIVTSLWSLNRTVVVTAGICKSWLGPLSSRTTLSFLYRGLDFANLVTNFFQYIAEFIIHHFTGWTTTVVPDNTPARWTAAANTFALSTLTSSLFVILWLVLFPGTFSQFITAAASLTTPTCFWYGGMGGAKMGGANMSGARRGRGSSGAAWLSDCFLWLKKSC